MSETISDADMAHLKTLARFELSSEETDSLKEDLNKILDAFAQLNALDTDGVEELTRPVPLHNVFREDEQRPSLPQDEVMGLAQETQEGFFKVPRTVDP